MENKGWPLNHGELEVSRTGEKTSDNRDVVLVKYENEYYTGYRHMKPDGEYHIYIPDIDKTVCYYAEQ